MTDDPYESATNARPRPKRYYGLLRLNAWYCVLRKGQGKVPFNADQHPIEQRRTAIDLTLIPLAEMGLSYNVERKMIAESREWYDIVWPSLKALGLTHANQAKDRYVCAEMAGTGRTYNTSSGQEREATTIKVLALYENADACREAYLATTETDLEEEPVPGIDTPLPGTEQGLGDDQQRAVAYDFLKALVKQFAGDPDRLRTEIERVSMVAQYFSIDSPETQALLQKQVAA